MRILISIFIACASIGVLAQEPVISGYLGKVNYAMLKYNTGVRTSHPEKWKTFSEVESSNFSRFSVKSELELNVGHVFSNRFVVEAIMGFNNMSMNLSAYGSPFYAQESSGFQREYHYYLGYPKVTDFYTGIGTKFYRRKKGALAPIGVYYGLKMNYHSYAVTLNDIIAGYYTNGASGQQQYQMNFGTFNYKFLEISGSLGYTRAVADNLILDYGFSVGWGRRGPKFYEPRIPFDAGFENDFLNMIKMYQVGKIHFGLGYLF